MDKYEFNIKVEQIKKLVNKGDFETAMKIADTIDWRRVRNTNLLSMIAEIYEKNSEYKEARDILLLAFERAPIGKRLLYKLAELALMEGSVAEAEDYYREFCDLAPEDPRQHLLRYMILKEKNATVEQLIHSLERYTSTELDEKWLYELAGLYQKADRVAECVSTCDRIMLMFGLGKYVEKSMDLKVQYQPLNSYQMDLAVNRGKYEAKLRAVEEAYSGSLGEQAAEEYEEEIIPQTIDEELAASIHEAEAEERLAEEMSRISIEDYIEQENPLENTKVIGDIRQLASQPLYMEEDLEQPREEIRQHHPEPPLDQPEIEEMEEEDLPGYNHLMIEARNPEKGLEMAIEVLKKIHRENGTKNPVVKISGLKLNQKGILNVSEKLSGKDLVIEEAGDLSVTALEELQIMITNDKSGMVVVLIDNPRQMEELHGQNPGLAGLFECIGVQDTAKSDTEKTVSKRMDTGVKSSGEGMQTRPSIQEVVPAASNQVLSAARQPEPDIQPKPAAHDAHEEMDLDEFAEYACKYAGEIDCSVTGKSMLALYERIEIMEEDGIALTRASAEDLIEEAADKAEKPSLGKLITGVFSSKYDKDGLLILKEEHFIGR